MGIHLTNGILVYCNSKQLWFEPGCLSPLNKQAPSLGGEQAPERLLPNSLVRVMDGEFAGMTGMLNSSEVLSSIRSQLAWTMVIMRVR